jgi:hypothetical protein
VRRIVGFDEEVHVVTLHAVVKHAKLRGAGPSECDPSGIEDATVSEGGHTCGRPQRHVRRAMTIMRGSPPVRHGATSRCRLAAGAGTTTAPCADRQIHLLHGTSCCHLNRAHIYHKLANLSSELPPNLGEFAARLPGSACSSARRRRSAVDRPTSERSTGGTTGQPVCEGADSCRTLSPTTGRPREHPMSSFTEVVSRQAAGSSTGRLRAALSDDRLRPAHDQRHDATHADALPPHRPTPPPVSPERSSTIGHLLCARSIRRRAATLVGWGGGGGESGSR